MSPSDEQVVTAPAPRSRSPASRAPSPSTWCPARTRPHVPGRLAAEVVPVDLPARRERRALGAAATPRPPSRSSAATAPSPSCCAGRRRRSTRTWPAGPSWWRAPAATPPGRAACSRCRPGGPRACAPASCPERCRRGQRARAVRRRAPAPSRPGSSCRRPLAVQRPGVCLSSGCARQRARSAAVERSVEPGEVQAATVDASCVDRPLLTSLIRAVRPVGPPGAPWHLLYFLPEPQGHVGVAADAGELVVGVAARARRCTSASPASARGASRTAAAGCCGRVEALGPDLRAAVARAASAAVGDRSAAQRLLDLLLDLGSSSSSSTWTSRLNRKPTDSSLMPSIIAANMSKPSRWYSTSGSRWE